MFIRVFPLDAQGIYIWVQLEKPGLSIAFLVSLVVILVIWTFIEFSILAMFCHYADR